MTNLENHARTPNDHDRLTDDVSDKKYTTGDVNLINISVLVEMPQLFVCMIVTEQFLPH